MELIQTRLERHLLNFRTLKQCKRVSDWDLINDIKIDQRLITLVHRTSSSYYSKVDMIAGLKVNSHISWVGRRLRPADS